MKDFDPELVGEAACVIYSSASPPAHREYI